MVVASASAASITMAWLSEIKRSLSATAESRQNGGRRLVKPATLCILAFDTAKIMARLVSLHKTLSDDEIGKLRRDVMCSRGVSYLNSKDQGFLLYLACAEILEDLDFAALTVARLGRKCVDFSLSRFDLVYSDLKMGVIDLSKMKFASRDAGKVVDQVQRLVNATANLYSALESLSEMEISERKLQVWRNNNNAAQKTNFDLFDRKISWQRKQVRMLREASLWSQTFDKAVGLMARSVCIVYARVCAIFGPYIATLPSISSRFMRSPPFHHQKYICALPVNGRASKSGPIAITPKQKLTRRPFSRKSTALFSDNVGFGVGFGIGYDENKSFRFDEMGKHHSVYQNAPASTVGGSGLALRYAHVIIIAERYAMNATAVIAEESREDLYQMLPSRLRAMVRSKMRNNNNNNNNSKEEKSLGNEEVKETLEWLAPMAHDTVKWQAARNLEKHMFDGKPTALLLQTLHYADREKTEEAIAEVLVGLSCVCRDQHRRAFDWYCRRTSLSSSSSSCC